MKTLYLTSHMYIFNRNYHYHIPLLETSRMMTMLWTKYVGGTMHSEEFCLFLLSNYSSKCCIMSILHRALKILKLTNWVHILNKCNHYQMTIISLKVLRQVCQNFFYKTVYFEKIYDRLLLTTYIYIQKSSFYILR